MTTAIATGRTTACSRRLTIDDAGYESAGTRPGSNPWPSRRPSARAVRPRQHPRRAGGRHAVEPEARRGPLFDEGGPLSKITTLRPRDYGEARTIGERFRDGTPVIMDLVEMSNADAKRLVDFAAGLAFALRGSFDKVATKVFLLSPADIDVSAEERRRIAETGFYSQKPSERSSGSERAKRRRPRRRKALAARLVLSAGCLSGRVKVWPCSR